MTDIEYLNKSIKEKIVERVKNGFFDSAGGYLKAMDYYAKGLITLDTVKSIEAEIEAWEMSKTIEPPVAEEPIEDIPTEETTEIEDETILDGGEGTETEVEATE
jgi:hypothetical protein